LIGERNITNDFYREKIICEKARQKATKCPVGGPTIKYLLIYGPNVKHIYKVKTDSTLYRRFIHKNRNLKKITNSQIFVVDYKNDSRVRF
jgi:hypothetical protein